MSSTNQTCVLGGPNVGPIEAMPGNIPTGMLYIGIEGNVTDHYALRACCKNHKAYHIEPCTMWCEIDSTLGDMYGCFAERMLFVQSSFSNTYYRRIYEPEPLTTEQIVGISFGALGVLLLIQVAIWRLVVCIKGRKTAARHSRLQQVEAGVEDFSSSLDDVGGYKYDHFKR